MRISRKTQNMIKNIDSVVLVIATVLGVAALFGGLSKKDDDERVKVHPTFSVGGLNEVGKYIESDGTIYTKEAFECQGLKIELDFEKTIFYEVYFYNSNGDFLSSTAQTNENSTPELPSFATHARIVITPDWELLEIEKKKEQVVKWYEVAKYANQITVKVNEEQEEIIYYGNTTLGSRELIIVTSFDDVVFSEGRVNEGVFAPSTGCATMIAQVVKVDGGETLAFKQNIAGITYYVEEHTSAPLTPDNINPLAKNNTVWHSSSMTLQDNTEYILVVVKNSDGTTAFTEGQLSVLNTCFEIK